MRITTSSSAPVDLVFVYEGPFVTERITTSIEEGVFISLTAESDDELCSLQDRLAH